MSDNRNCLLEKPTPLFPPLPEENQRATREALMELSMATYVPDEDFSLRSQRYARIEQLAHAFLGEPLERGT